MKVLILSSAFSGLTQRVQRELLLLGHQIHMHIDLDEDQLRRDLNEFQPALVICPFLTQRIPEDVWQKWTCLVVHPGIEGDRGPSSLDWAIKESSEYWGVTLLEAHAEMDAGNIWGTRRFPLRAASKLSNYKREVSTAAVELIKKALLDLNNPYFSSRPLDYTNPRVQGILRPLMKQPERCIDWQRDKAADIVKKLHTADTSPGVLDSINGVDIHLFGPVLEPNLRGNPGEIIAEYNEGICRATVDGAVWIRQMKCKTSASLPPIKLPAWQIAKTLLNDKQMQKVQRLEQCDVMEEIWTEQRGEATYIYFNFYNGAFSTQQCYALAQCVRDVKQSNTKFIVFMGGEDFWSNGIHLNCIEAASNPAEESWQNINAIDDVVSEIINTPNQITIAALRNNSGAGGSIMALACDEVIVRDGTVHNPHYEGMGLYGSEYWTYLLPKRVGKQKALELAKACEPMLAEEAIALGFADIAFTEDWDGFHKALYTHVYKLCEHMNKEAFLAAKNAQRAADEAAKPLAKYREEELAKMHAIFFNDDSVYHTARYEFVNKIKKPKQTAAPEKQKAAAVS